MITKPEEASVAALEKEERVGHEEEYDSEGDGVIEGSAAGGGTVMDSFNSCTWVTSLNYRRHQEEEKEKEEAQEEKGRTKRSSSYWNF